MPILPTDERGFLVGESIDTGELRDAFERMDDSLDSIDARLVAILEAIRGGGLVSRPRAKEVPTAEPVTRRSADGAARPEDSAKTAEKPSDGVAPKNGNLSERQANKPDIYSARKPNNEEKNRGASSPKTVEPTAKKADGAAGFVRSPSETVTPAKSAASSEVSSVRAGGAEKAAEPVRNRDANGRFVGSGGGSDGEKASVGIDDKHGTFARRLGSVLAESMTDAQEGVEEVDPTVKALHEAVGPLAKSASLVGKLTGFGEDSEGNGIMRRILRTLSAFRKEESVFAKSAKRTLEAIEDKPVGGSDDRGGIGGMLARGATAALPTIVKRIPLLGGLFAGATSIFDIFKIENDSTLSREEKDKRTGAAAGSGLGSVGGMFAGAKAGALLGSFAGPIGAAIGGVVGTVAGGFFGDKAGAIVGERVGEWVTDLRQADIPGRISAVWSEVKSSIESTWQSATAIFSDGWTAVTDAFTATKDRIQETIESTLKSVAEKALTALGDAGTALNDWVKEKTGIDVAGTAEKAAGLAVGAGKAISEGFRSAFSSLKGVFGGKEKAAPESPWADGPILKGKSSLTPEARARAKEGLGGVSKLFESGDRGTATISRGYGDHGGASYGTYQLSSRQGTLQKFLRESGYGAQFEGLTPGTAAFDAKWRELATGKDAKAFEAAEHGFIQATHYDPAMRNLQKAGIDLSGRGKAVQEMLWSTAVQFGAGRIGKDGKMATGATGLIQAALKGKNLNELSDAQIIDAVQNYKIENNDRLFRSSSAAVRAGTEGRAVQEWALLSEMADTVSPAQRATMSAPGTTVPEQAQASVNNTILSGAASAGATVHASPVTTNFPSRTPGVAVGAPSALQTIARPPQVSVVAPKAPPLAKAPAVPTAIAASGRTEPRTVRVEGDVSQDVRERRIAHIATGGFSS